MLCMMHAEQQILWTPSRARGSGLCVLGPQRKWSGNLTTTPGAGRPQVNCVHRSRQQGDRQVEIDHITSGIL